MAAVTNDLHYANVTCNLNFDAVSSGVNGYQNGSVPVASGWLVSSAPSMGRAEIGNITISAASAQ